MPKLTASFLGNSHCREVRAVARCSPLRLRPRYLSLSHLQQRCLGTRNGERTPC